MSVEQKTSEFLYRMSHSMREGLALALRYVNELSQVEELADYADLPDSPLENAKAALAPLIGQVSDFSDYAETVTGRMQIELEQDVDVYALIESTLSVADLFADQKDGRVTLEEELEEDLPTIEADPARLSQALLNLIHNAFKFTERGSVTVSVRREDADLLFEVRDTGIGISEADQELVFEPFETILPDKYDPRVGFGIGLKIVEHIIDLHGGETWFESEAGNGSSFFFTVPL